MTKRIAIIGAGPGGLTAGLALRRAGFDVSIHEQAPVLREVGAGLSLSRAAMSVYRELGLRPAIEAASTVTADMAFLHYQTGAILAGRLDPGRGSGDPDAPLAARQLHRSDLQTVLATAFRAAGGELRLGHALVGLESGATDNVTAVFANGERVLADLLVGADGLKSRVRSQLWGETPARFTGQVAYRFLVPAETGQGFLGFGRAAVFQGPGRIFNRYTIRDGRLINCVGIVRTATWLDDGWSIPADRAELLDLYAGWHGDVTGLIEQGDSLIKWGLFDRPPLPLWSRDRVTLLGDAAHPMLPFLGLGAAMAIEDAMVLARALAETPEIDNALARYENARRARTGLVHAQSVRQGELVQGSDPDRFDAGTAPSHDPAHYAYDPVSSPF